MEMALILAAGIWYWTLRRGRLAVQASVFLSVLHMEGSIESANRRACAIGYLEATQYVAKTKALVKEAYGGKQLRMIAEARTCGFAG